MSSALNIYQIKFQALFYFVVNYVAWAEYPEIGRDLAARTEDIETNAPFNQRMIADKIEETKNQLVNAAKAKERVGSDSDDFSSSVRDV